MNFQEGPGQTEGSRSSPLHLSCLAGGRRSKGAALGWSAAVESASVLMQSLRLV